MKLKIQALILIFAFFATGCGNISSDDVITKGGLLYKIGDGEPYSGTVTGYAREGYRSHKMKYRKKYKNGLRHGDTRFWYASGKLESVEPYSNGKINGIVTQYYKSGHIRARIHMVDSRRGGSKGEQFWHENEIAAKGFFKRFFK